jgi:hypothetical protein
MRKIVFSRIVALIAVCIPAVAVAIGTTVTLLGTPSPVDFRRFSRTLTAIILLHAYTLLLLSLRARPQHGRAADAATKRVGGKARANTFNSGIILDPPFISASLVG